MTFAAQLSMDYRRRRRYAEMLVKVAVPQCNLHSTTNTTSVCIADGIAANAELAKCSETTHSRLGNVGSHQQISVDVDNEVANRRLGRDHLRVSSMYAAMIRRDRGCKVIHSTEWTESVRLACRQRRDAVTDHGRGTMAPWHHGRGA